MSPEIGSIRVSQQAKEQMIKLKRVTGMRNWNSLCRWGLCVSLVDPSPPLTLGLTADSNVEMTWRTFAGQDETALLAIIALRAKQDRTSPEETLLAHIHRGLGQLSGTVSRDAKLEDFVSEALDRTA